MREYSVGCAEVTFCGRGGDGVDEAAAVLSFFFPLHCLCVAFAAASLAFSIIVVIAVVRFEAVTNTRNTNTARCISELGYKVLQRCEIPLGRGVRRRGGRSSEFGG